MYINIHNIIDSEISLVQKLVNSDRISYAVSLELNIKDSARESIVFFVDDLNVLKNIFKLPPVTKV